jgi:8-oxo-dGTP pyrophosphatase MutT (NUDIX family)
MRAEGLIHRATYIIVTDPDGLLYVQKRTMIKDVYPGWWDPCTGGVVLAGESYEDSAVRELEEEMGITNTPLEFLFDFYFAEGRVWGRAFHAVYEGPLRLQAEEVQYVERMTVDQILQSTEPVTPDGLAVVRRWSTRSTLR